MEPIICLAHGSRHPGADSSVARIARRAGELTGASAYAAYLDFSPLTPLTIATLLAASGHRRAIVVPTLFTRAFHLRHDVPAALAEATAETGVEFRTAEGIGTGADVADVLASRVPKGTGRYILYSVGSSVTEANDAVAELAAQVGSRSGADAVHVTATGPGDTGPEALWEQVEAAQMTRPDEMVHVAPLFTAPGTLWDAALARLNDGRREDLGIGVTTGAPLEGAVAPLVAARYRSAGSIAPLV